MYISIKISDDKMSPQTEDPFQDHDRFDFSQTLKILKIFIYGYILTLVACKVKLQTNRGTMAYYGLVLD